MYRHPSVPFHSLWFQSPLLLHALMWFGMRRFFMSWLLLFLVHNLAISIFRAIGAIARNIVVANACGSLMLMIILMLGGFVLPRGQIRGWWIWGYWAGLPAPNSNPIIPNSIPLSPPFPCDPLHSWALCLHIHKHLPACLPICMLVCRSVKIPSVTL